MSEINSRRPGGYHGATAKTMEDPKAALEAYRRAAKSLDRADPPGRTTREGLELVR